MDLFSFREIYFIGIKGAGMTALAELLFRQGIRVSGSDTEEIFYTDAVLRRLGISVSQPFSAGHIPLSTEAFIYSTAYSQENNVELREALATGKPVLSYPEALGLLTQQKLTLAVCGTHGKTTTSALLAETLKGIGRDPSAIVGSEIKNWGGGALAGKGQYLVVEADEYQDKLRFYHPFAAILTSVDWDHPDFFPDTSSYEEVFKRFVARIPKHGVLVACGDDARVLSVARSAVCKVITYGFHADNDVHIDTIRVIDPESAEGKLGLRQSFTLSVTGESYGSFSLRLAGKHNAQNAAAVVALLIHLKFSVDNLSESLSAFSGTKRRFEQLGEFQEALVFDDYAHHPDEIRVTLRAIRELYPKRKLTVVFHPHTFSRTKALLPEFAEALSEADVVCLLDIYGSARETHGGVSSLDITERINSIFPAKAQYLPNHQAVLEYLRGAHLSSTDLVVTMGAGDVWQVAESLLHSS